MKKCGILVAGLTTATLMLGAVGLSESAYAAGECAGVPGATEVTVNKASELCNIDGSVTTVNITGSSDDISAVINAYATLGWGNGGNNVTTYNATYTDPVGTNYITQVSGFASTNAEVNITTNGDIVYLTMPYAVPSNVSIDYDNTVVHLPDGTTVVAALALYKEINNKTVTVAEGNNFNILESTSSTGAGTAIHLNGGEDAKAVLGLIVSAGLKDVFVSVPDFHVNLYNSERVIFFKAGTTAAQVEAALSGLKGLDYEVRIINNSGYAAELNDMGVLTVTKNILSPATGFFSSSDKGGMVATYGALIAVFVAAMVAFGVFKSSRKISIKK